MIGRSCVWLFAGVTWVGFAGAAPTTWAQIPNSPEVLGAAARRPVLSATVGEVVRLAEGATTDEVIVAYIQDSSYPFNLTADQILYLRDLGLSPEIITAMLNRDRALRGQGALPPAAPEPAPPMEPAPPVYAGSPPAVVNYFYAGLSPYGAWVQIERLGWCWQPRAVLLHHGWRPYGDGGHWLYTDAGWCWQSDYSWGWAPFHYGRWRLHESCGWVWVPDTVWAPAWVTWRLGANGLTCGWAPLPPGAEFDSGWRFNGVPVTAGFGFGLRAEQFMFVPLKDFNEHHLREHCLDSDEVARIYPQTAVINNFARGQNTLVNHGLPVARIAEATHSEIRKVAIRDTPPGADRPAWPSRLGGEAVYRPPLVAAASAGPMLAQRIDERHPAVWYAPVAAGRVGGAKPGTMGAQRASPGSFRNPPAYTPNAYPQAAGAAASAHYAKPAPAAPVSTPAPARSAGYQSERSP